MQPNQGARKSHKKSRLGCSTCKLRRVKCDEQRPICDRCRLTGYCCDYTQQINGGVLRSSFEYDAGRTKLCRPLCSTVNTVLSNINNAILSQPRSRARIARYLVTSQDLRLLHDYRIRTLFASTPEAVTKLYKSNTVELMSQTPCLLHAVLTLTSMHGRYLAGSGHLPRTQYESLHWATAASCLKRDLSSDLARVDGEALWIATASLSWISLCAIETNSIEDVWPLTAESVNDLNWLEMQKGMRAVWATLASSKASSAFWQFRSVKPGRGCIGIPKPKPGIDRIPAPLVVLCGLNEASSSETSPYHSAVRILSELLYEADNFSNAIRFLAFPNTMEEDFCILLRQRDPRALLLMALWYELVPPDFWWISMRASLERQAVWTYLTRYHCGDYHIRHFVTSYSPHDLCLGNHGSDSEWRKNLATRLRDLSHRM